MSVSDDNNTSLSLDIDHKLVFPTCLKELSTLVSTCNDTLWLSLVLGAIEHTCVANYTQYDSLSPFLNVNPIELRLMYHSFVSSLDSLSLVQAHDENSIRTNIRAIAIHIISMMANRFYKDRPHLQSVYSLLKLKRLDCFGLALTVFACCRFFNYDNIYLTLSEDHCWISFIVSEDMKEDTLANSHILHTAEVSWLGRSSQHRLATPIGTDESQSWLYAMNAGHAIQCQTYQEVAAAMVSSINSELPNNAEVKNCAVLDRIKQALLWQTLQVPVSIAVDIFPHISLSHYSVGLVNLAVLERKNFTNHSSAEELLHFAICVDQKVFSNTHVYPYTTLGDFYRKQCYDCLALQAYVCAASVASSFKFDPSNDEQLITEISEVHQHIRKMLTNRRQRRENLSNHMSSCQCCIDDNDNFRMILNPYPSLTTFTPHTCQQCSGHCCRLHDKYMFSDVLSFYDTLCRWERCSGSMNRLSHRNWAADMFAIVSYFDYSIRSTTLTQSEDRRWGSNKMAQLVSTFGMEKLNKAALLLTACSTNHADELTSVPRRTCSTKRSNHSLDPNSNHSKRKRTRKSN